MLLNTVLLTVAAFGSSANAAAAAYAQCGGQGFTGDKTCVSGYTCVANGVYYSQCLPASNTAKPASTSKTSAAPVSTSKAASGGGSSGTTYKASFTQYGSGDTFGSGNCNTKTTACGFYTSPGYSAALSQNAFGVGPGAGAGPACGTCWKLTAQTDSSGHALSNAGNTIVVQITNLCPADGNPLCSQNGLTGTNQYGANLNFDLCLNSGANTALFGNSGVGLAVGTAVQVSCSQWSGTVVH
ncbi:hypothetical protein D6C86_10164 [Aureobasidium pullulans]|uniref:Expansin-like EG45 domain-containing protein n=1 Tax=Aureobasidium pullulans TaxID=5580 RepID=A0A4S9EWJ8_AURPU|nr:hypothetical protein D6D29_03866 [Aureobasidium pullulans]THV97369.1 hypothetical protein D6D27_02156 [Aureobasidium pullulans]THW10402.1 hypothetical protein D6D24_07981 [Aureobasidium pullulans]THW31671.1 hypothetical protein D6D25_05634 [Aureobasidium pullulans]THW38096.1 hypothetical protein D6D22_06906 [Aureobasidium pullulans]